MNKKLLWVAAAVAAILLIYFIAAKLLLIPFVVTKVAALIVGLVGAVTGLFLRRKRAA